MADVEISYNNSVIASLSDSGTEILETDGTFMSDDVTISYTKPPVGTDTSDATLSNSYQMLNGVTAYARGTKYTGAILSRAAQTITPTTSNKIIPSGLYLSGSQTIEGIVCTNLTAANIADGVTVKIGTATDDDSVASVTGTHQGGGGGISATTVHFSSSACPNAEYGGVIAYVDGTGTEQRTSALDPNYEGVDISMLSKSILVFFEQQNPMQTGAFNKDEITGMTQVKSSSIGSGAGKTWYKIFQVD